nr:NADH dehydrogenase subunit 4 [Nipponacmea sp. JM-2022]
MKLALVLGFISMLFSISREEGHFMRCVWAGLGSALMCLLCYRPGVTHFSVIGWGLYSNQLTSWLVCLTWFITFLSLVVSTSKVSWSGVRSLKAFGVVVWLINLAVSLSFLVSNLLWFYILFEGSLVPMFYLVAGWGSYQERVEAGYYMVMYTVGASLPLLMVISFCQGSLSKSVCSLMLSEVSVLPSSVICYGVLMAFLVKLPLYPLHLWLPKAHVEAPTAGSMILAGVMLKLGGFGVVCSLDMFSHYMSGELWVVSSFALVGGMLAAGYCLLQVDLKAAIAYSSVAHMSLVIYGAMSLNSWGMNSCTLTMVSHGLTSSGLFCLTHWVYELVGSRLLSVVGGLMVSARSLSLWGVALLSANIPTPPWLSIAGEVMVVPSIMAHETHYLLIFPMAVMMFMGAAFSLNIYVELFQGSSNQTLQMKDLDKVGHLSLYGHVVPLLGLMVMMDKMVT